MKLSTCVLVFGFLAFVVIVEARRPYYSGPAYDQEFQSVSEQEKEIGWFKSIWYNILSKLGFKSQNDQDDDGIFSGLRPSSQRAGNLRKTETGDKVRPMAKCTSKRNPPTPYDILMLALTWTPGQCYQNKDCGSKLPDTFALHGLWPSKSRTFGPDCCTDNIDFFNGNVNYTGKTMKYFNAVQNIVKNRMVSLYSATSSSISLFHQYEWTKHGTCAVGSNTALNDPVPYFQKMIEIDNKIGGANILANAGVPLQADIPVQTTKIENAVKSRVNNVKIQMRCRQFAGVKPGTTVYLMHEIRVCIQTDGITPVNCPNVPAKSQCGSEVYLKFSQ